MRLSFRHFRLAVFGLLLLFALAPSSFGARRERLIDSWKPLHFNLTFVLDDRLTELTRATAEITVVSLKENLTEVDLDFGDLTVDSVLVSGHSASYQRNGGLLRITLPNSATRNTPFRIVVSYHGTPKDGLILSADKAGKPSAVGDNWPDRAHHWIPCLDHPAAKATVNFTVTAPARTLVVANGKLDRVETTSTSTRTWFYQEAAPISPYCMIIAVGEFARLAPPEQEITPLAYYVPEPDRDYAMKGFAPAGPSLKFFTQTIAPYPYEKLDLIVGATRFGGMENSSAIVFGSTVFNPSSGDQPTSKTFKIRESLVALVAHEIAHQWFGDSVTEATWADLWLSEGFATYFAALFLERHDGKEAFQKYMGAAGKTYFNFNRRNNRPLHDTETENLMSLLNANNYQKGAWVLHMLRAELGEKDFFEGLRGYYSAHRNSTASSEDLRAALEKSSGKQLKSFFASWVYGPGHPKYGLTWEWNRSKKRVKLNLKQLQAEAPFPNAVTVEILTNKKKRRYVIKPTGKETVEEISVDGEPREVKFDPEDTVLDESEVSRTLSLHQPLSPG